MCRQLQEDGLNRTCVSDFTYNRTDEGWMYVAAVQDLHSRRTVGGSMRKRICLQFAVDALMMAVLRRGKFLALRHHSEQGCWHTSEHFQKLRDE